MMAQAAGDLGAKRDYFEDPGTSILRDQGGSVLRAHFHLLSRLLRSRGRRFSATRSAAFLGIDDGV